ncbi:hypothetical protein HYV72_01360 [Candidatus Uhrbacteria bacterium]|nr:hypothetical protein [Candidatus Uhrbacteria bacterium]
MSVAQLSLDDAVQSRMDRLNEFWRSAVTHGFGNQMATEVAPRREGFPHAFSFSQGNFEYREEFAGEKYWGGDEVVFLYPNQPIWRLSAHGAFEPQGVNDGNLRTVAIDFLREALMRIRCVNGGPAAFAPRGPLSYVSGKWAYRCTWEGGFDLFHGTETVSQLGVRVLTQYFHGGLVLGARSN